MPTLHSKLGASGAHRWINCPGSIRLSESVSEAPTSKWAAEGTAAHALGEKCLLEDNAPKAYFGQWIDSDENFYATKEEAEASGSPFIFEVDEDMVSAVKVYVDFINEVYDSLDLMGEDPDLFVEEGFDLSFIQAGMFGTNDASIFASGRELIVVDYKHGAGKVVEVEDNPQLLYYALGALRKLCYDNVHGGGWDEKLLPTRIRIVVIQPRASHPNGPVREWVTTPDYLIHDFAEMLTDAAKATQRVNADRRAGDWCQFCPAKTICSEYEEMLTTPSLMAFDEADFDDISDLDPKAAKARGKDRGKILAKEGPERLASILAIAPMFDAMVEAAKAQALEMVKSGQQIPGFKLVRGTKHRRWKDPAVVVDTLSIAVSEDDLFERKIKSPAKLENEGFGEVIDGLWEKPEGSLTIAPESDKRPGITVFDDQDLID